jgi:hypothetical protein
MTQNHDVGTPGDLLVWTEVPSNCWLPAEERKEARCDPHPAELFGAIAVDLQVGPFVRGKSVEGPNFLTIGEEVCGRHRPFRLAFVRVVDPHEPIGRVVGQRLHQHAMDDAEDRCVCADADAQRDDRDCCKPRRSQQQPSAKSNVLDDGEHRGISFRKCGLVSGGCAQTRGAGHGAEHLAQQPAPGRGTSGEARDPIEFLLDIADDPLALRARQEEADKSKRRARAGAHGFTTPSAAVRDQRPSRKSRDKPS